MLGFIYPIKMICQVVPRGSYVFVSSIFLKPLIRVNKKLTQSYYEELKKLNLKKALKGFQTSKSITDLKLKVTYTYRMRYF